MFSLVYLYSLMQQTCRSRVKALVCHLCTSGCLPWSTGKKSFQKTQPYILAPDTEIFKLSGQSKSGLYYKYGDMTFHPCVS